MLGSLMDQASPGRYVGGCAVPCGDVNIEVFQVDFEGVFVALARDSCSPFAVVHFAVHQLLRDPRILHPEDMPCPSCLSLAQGGDDVWEFCSLYNLSVRDLVLPMDVEDVSKTSKTKVMQYSFILSVDGLHCRGEVRTGRLLCRL